MKTKNENNEDIRKALGELAKGMVVEEVMEEYVVSDSGAVELQKKRVTKKKLPPDLDAFRILYGDSAYKELSDAELAKEKRRLLKLLKD